MINGKVVDESSEVEQIEERKKWAQFCAERNNVSIFQPKMPTGFNALSLLNKTLKKNLFKFSLK